VHDLAFLVPNYDWWEAPFYGLGLKLYQLLAGKHSFGASHLLSREETLARLPTLKQEGLRGGAIYYDGQFDDARLLIHMVATAYEQGATLLNYVAVTGFIRNAQGLVNGVQARNAETGQEFHATAKVIVNATGAFSDRLRLVADPDAISMISPSQGIHLVFDSAFLAGETASGKMAIMVPHTSDGRVLFAIPWHGHTLVGTTETPISTASLEPVPLQEEIDFILATASQYLAKPPSRDDVLSVFAGIRPLVGNGKPLHTAALSRDHVIHSDRSGLISVMGGKWTTYRRMAEDCIDHAISQAELPPRKCVTQSLRIHGFHVAPEELAALAVYGSDTAHIRRLIETDASLGEKLHPALPYIKAEIVWAARNEMARTLEDALARRTRALFLNARAALEMAPSAADVMAAELGWSDTFKASQLALFRDVAQSYMLPPNS